MSELAADRVFLARRYLGIGQPAKALETLDHAEPDLDDPEPWAVRGLALFDLDRHEEAARVAREGLARVPEDVALLFLLAAAEAQLDHLAEGEAAILAALRGDSEDVDCLCLYAGLLTRGGQLEKAEEVVARAGRLEPESLQVLRARRSLAYVRGRRDEAARISQELLAHDPEDKESHRMLAVSAFDKGAYRAAQRHMNTAARGDPTDTETAEAARATRADTHWLLWPLLPLHRLGVAGTWVGAVAIIFALRASGIEVHAGGGSTVSAAGAFTVLWLSFCVYSWIAPSLVRRWLDFRGP